MACGGDLERLDKSLEEFFSGQLETLPEGSVDQEPQQTLSFHRVLQRAVIHAQSAESKEINGGNLLIAMYREPDSYAVFLLEEQGITRFDRGQLCFPRHVENRHRGRSRDAVRRGRTRRGEAIQTGKSAGSVYRQPGRQSGAGQSSIR